MTQTEPPVPVSGHPLSAREAGTPPRAVWARTAVPPRAGAGLKGSHVADILADPGPVAFFEVHAENYMGAGGPPHAALSAIRERFPLSVHGVGLSIGASHPLDAGHVARLKAVVERYEPGLVSEHLAWSSHGTNDGGGAFLNDLLPVPYTRAVLDRVCEHVEALQEALGRTILLENPSSYLAFEASTMVETDFIAAIARRTGCGLLLDINNVFVSATNQQTSAWDYLDAFPLDAVGEIHLAGHAEDRDDEGDILLIDAHDRPVADPVWTLYRHVIERAGPRPTLVEWDNDVPEWNVLKREAALADAILAGRPAASGRGGATDARASRERADALA